MEKYTIIDNDATGFSKTGTWTLAASQPNRYGESYRYAQGTSGSATAQATYTFPITVTGMYEIVTWYPEASNRATDAPFTIYHADGQTTVRINQQTTGGQWRVLGQFSATAGQTLRVVLSNNVSDATKLVLADAVGIALLPGPTDVNGWLVH